MDKDKFKPIYRINGDLAVKVRVGIEMTERSRLLELQKNGKFDGEIPPTPTIIYQCNSLTPEFLGRMRERGRFLAQLEMNEFHS